MGLINHYINKYLNKFKAKYGDKAYIEVHLDERCIVKSEKDDKVLFECDSFAKLMDDIG